MQGIKMHLHDHHSPCAADALFGIMPVLVNGKPVGIIRLCDAIDDVRSLGLAYDDEIKIALLERVEQNNYIPEALRTGYADALLAEYYRILDEHCGSVR
jgi:hypothetical protein